MRVIQTHKLQKAMVGSKTEVWIGLTVIPENEEEESLLTSKRTEFTATRDNINFKTRETLIRLTLENEYKPPHFVDK